MFFNVIFINTNLDNIIVFISINVVQKYFCRRAKLSDISGLSHN